MSERDTLARTFAGLHSKDPGGPRRGLRLGAAPVTALLVLAVWLLTIAGAGWSLSHGREAALRKAGGTAGNLAALLAQDVRGRLDAMDMLVTGMTERVEIYGLGVEDLRRLDQVFANRVRRYPGLHHVGVVDATGRYVASSDPEGARRVNVSERDYFIHHRTHADADRFLSKPFKSYFDGRWVIAVTHRWNQPDGSFGGVVIATTDLTTMQASYRPLNLGAEGAASLWAPPGIIVARVPESSKAIGQLNTKPVGKIEQDIATGAHSEISRSSVDGIERVYAAQRVDGYDLVQVVGLASAEILAGWHEEVRKTAAVVLGVLLLTGLMGVYLVRLMQRQRNERAAYRLLTSHATDMILCMDTQFIRRYVSPASFEILGYRPEELVGKSPLEVSHPDDLAQMRAAFEAVLGGAERRSTDNRIRHADGRWVWVDVTLRRIASARGETIGIIAALRDSTARKATELALENANRHLAALAKSDGLTGLANRRHFDEVMDTELRRADRVGAPLTLVLLDVDRFKAFNDRYGHLAGDSCLRMIAEAVLASLQRPADLAARYGGEELAVVLPDTETDGGRRVAERIAAAVRAAGIAHVDGVGGIVTVSIGVAVYLPSHELSGHRQDGGSSAVALIGAADRALYAAKAAGRARIKIAAKTVCMDPAAH